MRKLAINEGAVEGQNVTLPVHGIPDDARVHVLAELETLSALRVASPHLADPQQAKDFEKQVIEGETEAGA